MTPEGIFSIVKLCQVYHLIILNLSWFIYNQIGFTVPYCTFFYGIPWDMASFLTHPVQSSRASKSKFSQPRRIQKTRSDLVAIWKSYDLFMIFSGETWSNYANSPEEFPAFSNPFTSLVDMSMISSKSPPSSHPSNEAM